ncbi:hypothetical protein FKM82_030450 [Ascaphus truei]
MWCVTEGTVSPGNRQEEAMVHVCTYVQVQTYTHTRKTALSNIYRVLYTYKYNTQASNTEIPRALPDIHSDTLANVIKTLCITGTTRRGA